MSWTDVASVLIALAAFRLARLALIRSDRNASAANLIALNEGFRQAWLRFLSAKEESARQYEFAELANLLEIACAILHDRAIHGSSRKLLDEYLENILKIIDGHEAASNMLKALEERATTFEFVRTEIAKRRKIVSLR